MAYSNPFVIYSKMNQFETYACVKIAKIHIFEKKEEILSFYIKNMKMTETEVF
jgi:hypothetical protein